MKWLSKAALVTRPPAWHRKSRSASWLSSRAIAAPSSPPEVSAFRPPCSPAPAETPAWSVSLRPEWRHPPPSAAACGAPRTCRERVAASRPQAPRAAQAGEGGSWAGPASRAASPRGKSSRDRPEPASPAPWERPPPRLGGRAWPASLPSLRPAKSPQPCHPSQMSQAGPNREESAIGEVAGDPRGRSRSRPGPGREGR